MVLELIIPEKSKEASVKDIVFSLLVEESNQTLTKMQREMKKRGKSVSFQAVLKAVNFLFEKGILVKEKKEYSLNKDWIFQIRSFFDKVYSEQFKVSKPMKKVDLGKDIVVYTLGNLLELDRLWNELLMNWAKEEKVDKRNCWKGNHAWWLIPRLQEEDILHDFMVERGIKTYNLWTENEILDKQAIKYYSRRNEYAKFNKKVELKNNQHISVFGDNIVKFEIPKSLSDKINVLYKKTKNLKNLDIKKAIDISKDKNEIELIVIKDSMLANKIKEEIVGYFDSPRQQ